MVQTLLAIGAVLYLALMLVALIVATYHMFCSIIERKIIFDPFHYKHSNRKRKDYRIYQYCHMNNEKLYIGAVFRMITFRNWRKAFPAWVQLRCYSDPWQYADDWRTKSDHLFIFRRLHFKKSYGKLPIGNVNGIQMRLMIGDGRGKRIIQQDVTTSSSSSAKYHSTLIS